jgi:hypothetical protein
MTIFVLDPATNTWVQKDEPGPNYSGSSTPVSKADEQTEQVGGSQNYAGTSIAALKPPVIEATTSLLPKDGSFTNLDVAGDSIFHGKATFLSGLHVEWYDASQNEGTDIVIDLSHGPHQFVVLGENKKIWIPSKPDDELMFSLLVIQDSTGGWTVDWEINGGDQATDGLPIVYWPAGAEPTMTATAAACDMYSFSWLSFLNDGKGAYVAMATQDLRIPTA